MYRVATASASVVTLRAAADFCLSVRQLAKHMPNR